MDKPVTSDTRQVVFTPTPAATVTPTTTPTTPAAVTSSSRTRLVEKASREERGDSKSLPSRAVDPALGAALLKLRALGLATCPERFERFPARGVDQVARLLDPGLDGHRWHSIDQIVAAWVEAMAVREAAPGAGQGPQFALAAAHTDALFELLASVDEALRDGLLACGVAALEGVLQAAGPRARLAPGTETVLVDGVLALCIRHAQAACAGSAQHPPGLRDMDVREADPRALLYLGHFIRHSATPASHLARVAERIARIDPPLHPVVLQRLVAQLAAHVFAATRDQRPEPDALAAFIEPLLRQDDRLPLRSLVHAGLGLASNTVDGPWGARVRTPDRKSGQQALQASTQVFMRALLAHAQGVAPARLGAMVMAMVHVQNLGPLPSPSGLGEAAVVACVQSIVQADPPCTPAQRTAMVAAIGRELVPQGRKASNFAALDRLLADACRASRQRLAPKDQGAVDDIERGWQLALDPASVQRLEGWDERSRFELLELLLVVPGRIEDPQSALAAIGALTLDASRAWMRTELALRLAAGTRLDLEPSGWPVLHQALLARLHDVEAIPGLDGEAVIETKAGPARPQEPVVRSAVARWRHEDMAAYCAAFEAAHDLPPPSPASAASDFTKRLARAEALLGAAGKAS